MSTPTTRVPLAAFWHDLPVPARWMLSTIVVDFFGNGLVLPFSVVYLHEVRGFALSLVGVLLAIPALVGIVVVGPGGALVDRVGARPVMTVVVAGQLVALVVWATATTVPQAVVATVLQGLFNGLAWPTVNALIASLVPSGLRQRYFGVNFTLLNLGIGVGGVVGGLVVDVHRPGTFVALYLVDAATFLAPLAVLLGPLRRVSGKAPAPLADAVSPGDVVADAATYRRLVRDPRLLPILALGFVTAFIGYGQLSSGLPAFARAASGISTQALGWAFAANTAVIVVLQLVVLQRIEGRRRTRLLCVMAAVWGVSFLCLGASSLVPGTLAASLLFGACASVFGLGETFFQPTLPAMVNDLAPDHLRGRYNAMSSLVFQVASVLAPACAGVLVGHGLAGGYVVLLLLGCAAAAGLALLAERRVPPAVNGVVAPVAAGATTR